MKKVLAVVVLTGALALAGVFTLTGCGATLSEKLGASLDANYTSSYWAIYPDMIKLTDTIVYDSRTGICYYYQVTSENYKVLTPFYGSDKQLVTKDEFIKLYQNK